MPQADLIFLYGESARACTHHIDKHYVGYQTLQYMAGGGVELWIGSQRHLLEGEWFWSAYPGPRVRFCAAPGFAAWDHRYLAFQGPLVARWEREGLFPLAPCRPPADGDYARRLDDLLEASRRSDRRGVRRAVHLLEGILLELADLEHGSAAPPPWVDELTRTLAAAASADVSNYATMARDLGISESTLRRRFRQATGTSPHAYLLQCRATEARRLLGESDLPVKAIARQLGYRDVFFFSRQFRQLTGASPAAYRKSRQR